MVGAKSGAQKEGGTYSKRTFFFGGGGVGTYPTYGPPPPPTYPSYVPPTPQVLLE